MLSRALKQENLFKLKCDQTYYQEENVYNWNEKKKKAWSNQVKEPDQSYLTYPVVMMKITTLTHPQQQEQNIF